jgi:copper(I)-binding protein
VEHAWVRATVPAQKATGAFMRIVSHADAWLVAAASPVAASVEIHESSMHDNVMRMRAVPRVPLRANQAFELKPGGHHVMLMGLRAPLNAGEHVPITLTFEDAKGKRSTVEVSAVVRPLTSMPDKHGH